jgi:hypothetical protein
LAVAALKITTDLATDELAPIPEHVVEHGEVFTRGWVVDLILDLVGYTSNRDLATLRLIEPACGRGAFLASIVRRLSAACRAHSRPLSDAKNSIRAFDLLAHNVSASRDLITHVLVADGWPISDIEAATRTWVSQEDYLLREIEEASADVIVGNPPYVRLEDVPDERMQAYRDACPTMTGRADLYIGFFEIALRSLRHDGVLGYICADRWMRNQYGRHLRQMIADQFAVDLVLSMHDVNAFHEHVSAYPAITIIRRTRQNGSVAADATGEFREDQAADFLQWYKTAGSVTIKRHGVFAARLPHWFPGSDSWPWASPGRLAVIEQLNERFPPLSDPTTGTRVGIGVATGADGVYVTDNADLVERSRMLPLAMVADISRGTLSWSRHYLVDPWQADGQLVNLADYPKLSAHFYRHLTALRRRNVAQRQAQRWYRTIDRVFHDLTAKPKLLFSDMKLVIDPVLEPGGLYPHHNLYYITSDTWDLRVLGGLLLSKVAEAFVDAYGVKMRGGTLRFQAQYLRRIRIPDYAAVSEPDRKALIQAFEDRDVSTATNVALRLYGLTELPD